MSQHISHTERCCGSFVGEYSCRDRVFHVIKTLVVDRSRDILGFRRHEQYKVVQFAANTFLTYDACQLILVLRSKSLPNVYQN